MKIVMLISVLEMAAFTAWMIYKYYGRHRRMMLARSQVFVSTARRLDLASLTESRHYPFIDDRQLEGQLDDRRPMSGVVAPIGESGAPSGRVLARRSHQLMYKKWSQERRHE